MKKTALATVLSGILTSLWLGVPACAAQAAGAAVPAPVPGQIANAKSVFISNMGVDAVSLAAFKREQAPDKPYGEFYAAMKAWGRYELVDNPGTRIWCSRWDSWRRWQGRATTTRIPHS
jgi:hypothetical protein